MEFLQKKIFPITKTVITGGTGSTKIIPLNNNYTDPENIYLGWTGTTGTGYTKIIDKNIIYNVKILLTQKIKDIGFFDAYEPPPLIILSVATLIIESISDDSAKGGGIVLADGGNPVTIRGIVWSINPNPTTADTKTINGNGLGIFISELTELIPETTYYVRAYAVNSTGIVYGQEVNFVTRKMLTIITSPVTPLSTTTAIGGGEILTDGGNPIYERGIVWGTSLNPTITNNKITCGWGIGIFTTIITGLTTLTTYHVRAYAINSEGVEYGDDVVFTSIGIPTILTSTITSILETTAMGGGNVISDGGTNVFEKGIVFGLNSNPTYENDNIIADGTGIGIFTSTITGLFGITKYYVKAYAINLAGIAYGNEVNFTTIVKPIVVTISISNITQTTAKSGGNITNDGGGSITAKGVEYGNVSGALTLFTNDGTGSNSFVSFMTGLVPNTTFYVRAYATNAVGTGYGAELSYTTLPIPPPTISVYELGPTTQTTSVIRANIVNTGSHVVTTRGIAYSTNPDPTILNYFVSNGSGNGMFDTTIGTNSPATNVPLMPGYTYYVRAYLYTAEDGYLYSNTIQIAALPITIPTLTTRPISNITSYGADSGGINISDGGGYIISKGLKWGSDINTTNTIINTGGNADFTNSLSGLYTNSVYYVRAFATNSAGTGYGGILSFTTLSAIPTVTTTSLTNITTTSALAGGYVTTDGSAVIARGFQIGIISGVYLYTISAGSGIGAFSATLSPLSPNTVYYVRAFATNSAGTGYGTEESFITNLPPLPTIYTYDLAQETSNSAGVRGDITSDAGHNVITRGVVWDYFGNTPTITSFYIASGAGVGIFDVTIQPLNPSTTYSARAYLFTNEDGYIYGNTVLITTLTPPAPTVPTVGATAISSITSSSANGSSSVTNNGGATVTTRGFQIGTSSGSYFTAFSATGTDISFGGALTSLSPNTLYYVRAYATNSVGTGYGVETSFTTAALTAQDINFYLDSQSGSDGSVYSDKVFHLTSTPVMTVGQSYNIRLDTNLHIDNSQDMGTHTMVCITCNGSDLLYEHIWFPTLCCVKDCTFTVNYGDSICIYTYSETVDISCGGNASNFTCINTVSGGVFQKGTTCCCVYTYTG